MGKSYFFERFVAVFGHKYGCSRPKKIWETFFCQNPFSAFLRLKKVSMAIKLEGGGGGG